MKLFVVLVFLFSVNLFAGEVDHLRDDQTIPSKCKTNEVADFLTHDLDYYTYSRTGGERRGFDYEVEISREDVRKLWGEFKGMASGKNIYKKKNRDKEKRSGKYKMYYDMILENYKKMDFNFQDEGQILEILVVLKIKESLPDGLYVTGSVAYQGRSNGNRIGELDVVVGDVKTCQIFYVGEVKISPRRLGHARSQLSRFRRFLDSYN